jgi:glutamate/aspartate transport system permease protein
LSRYNWNWGVLFSDPYLGWLASGLAKTVLIALSAWAIAFALGSALGILRTLPWKPARAIGTAYVETVRGIPLLVQMFLWFFVVPELVPEAIGWWLKREMPYPEVTTAIVALGFYTAARVAEQVRAGIESVPKGLVNAALAVGLAPAQLYRHILMPLAYRIIVPPMTSEFLGIFKNSSLALTIGVLELTAQSRQIESYTFQGYEAFTAATLIYLAIAMVVLFLTRRLEARTRIPGMMAREQSTI